MPELTQAQIADMLADRKAGTPGPWRADSTLEVRPTIVSANGLNVGCAYLGCGVLGIETDINARRIARVPDMEDTIAAQSATIARLEAENARLREALGQCELLIDKALPCFDWGRSPLTADAIRILNETPGIVRAALEAMEAGNV